jgi:hypothetical protein
VTFLLCFYAPISPVMPSGASQIVLISPSICAFSYISYFAMSNLHLIFVIILAAGTFPSHLSGWNRYQHGLNMTGRLSYLHSPTVKLASDTCTGVTSGLAKVAHLDSSGNIHIGSVLWVRASRICRVLKFGKSEAWFRFWL